jgi:hypothetical protein
MKTLSLQSVAQNDRQIAYPDREGLAEGAIGNIATELSLCAVMFGLCN